jgi:hypothetical protein
MSTGNLSTLKYRESNGQCGTEQGRFAQRLRIALTDSNFEDDSPTHLAREFNARFPDLAVSVHAARKWLVGEAIPTQAKLIAIAKWLNVSAGWLRFADTDARRPCRNAVQFHTSALTLMADLQRLDKKQLEVAREFIKILLRANRK